MDLERRSLHNVNALVGCCSIDWKRRGIPTRSRDQIQVLSVPKRVWRTPTAECQEKERVQRTAGEARARGQSEGERSVPGYKNVLVGVAPEGQLAVAGQLAGTILEHKHFAARDFNAAIAPQRA